MILEYNTKPSPPPSPSCIITTHFPRSWYIFITSYSVPLRLIYMIPLLYRIRPVCVCVCVCVCFRVLTFLFLVFLLSFLLSSPVFLFLVSFFLFFFFFYVFVFPIFTFSFSIVIFLLCSILTPTAKGLDSKFTFLL